MVEKIQEIFYEVNMKAGQFEQGGIRAIATKKLTEQERNSRVLDFLGGFEILDDDFRLFVFEGLSDGVMKLLDEKIPINEPNSESFKILKNSDIKFKERIYQDFNLEIKRIRLRNTLKQILQNADIYIRTKVPENICKALNQISEICKCQNMKTLYQFDLFPLANDLIGIERKYSDSLTLEDIYGHIVDVKQTKKKQQQFAATTQAISVDTKNQKQSQLAAAGTIGNLMTIQNELSLPKQQNKSLKGKTMYLHQTKLKGTIQKNDIKIQNVVQIPENEPVYIYSCQKNNWYEKLMREQREKIKNDKIFFYTYSEQYLGLSIDPYNVEDEKKLALTLEKTQLQSKPEFRTVPPKTLEQYKEHPKKPHESIIEDLAQNPYYEQRVKQEESLKFSKERIRDKSKKDFNQYIGHIDVFSLPEILETEKIKPIEKERLEREKKKKEIEKWQKKLKGDAYIHIKKQMQEHPSQLDKLKGIRDGPALKKGILLKNSRIQNSTLQLEKQIKDIPSSVFHQEPYQNPVDLFQRKIAPEKAVSPYDFDLYQNPEILTKTCIYKPLKLDSMFK
ncbi:hypothetical protein IMG5_203820 [Ichthyophthirius multifiliis]|uniref:Uncharacterized protein n=1 Tax=Ichthyophthirius multifiliis TaxID=5932 RepID=G0R6C3_ICHMU|nr:hypothetical protein IMG5_203820 [Ichthyophthirius multifiliis]EGR26983.1 hypothetical protein IMG5_203820 [Ichthyophthirius multifiliis]|eukprot:XP_004023867.1 hypothetical protein IMG5_203820 [Ichthyophthirius multifiliis]